MSFGIIYGYGVRTLQPLVTIGAGLTLFGCFITALVMGESMGPVCALVAAAAMAGPLFLGLVFGWSLKQWLRARGYKWDVYFAIPLLFVPWALDNIETAIDLPVPAEEFTVSRVIPVPPAAVWKTSLDATPMLASSFEEFGLPRPEYATGKSTSIGDRKRFVYDKGSLEVEIVQSLANRRIEFVVVEQIGLEKRGAVLLGGSMTLTPAGAGTEVVLRMRYQPLMTPRWQCRTPERWVATAAANRVLDWLEARLRGRRSQ
jgi:hypothetical protein